MELVLKWLGVFPSAVLILTFVYVIFRTESLYILRTWAWRIVAGKSLISDPTIFKFQEEQNNLTGFRFFSGVKVKSTKQIPDVIALARKCDTDVHEFARCGNYFDASTLQVKTELLPSRWLTTLISWAAMTLLALVVFASAFGVQTSDAYLAFKDDRQWFTLNTFEAKLVFSGHPPLTLEGCKSNENFGFSSQHKVDICTILASKEIGEVIERYLESQRKASVYLLLVFSVLLMFPIAFLARVHKARGLDKKIKEATSPKSEDPAYGPA
jgi:hypothetical protein